MADRKQFTERVVFSKKTCRIVEDVQTEGLDPELYIGVTEGELGRGGKVSLNHTVYPVVNFIEQVAKMDQRAKDSFVDGEENHPDWGRTFKIPVRFLDVSTEMQKDGSVLAFGRMAFMNTTSGRDMLVLYKAGLEVGISHRGWGFPNFIVIEEDSPYWAANEEFRGEEVVEIVDFELETFDLVRDPAMTTYLERFGEHTNPEIMGALKRINALWEDNMAAKVTENDKAPAVETPEVEAVVVEAPVVEAPVVDVDALIAAAVEAALAEKGESPFSALDADMQAKLLSIATAFGTPEAVDAAVEVTVEGKAQARIAELETSLETVTAERDVLQAEKDELARKAAEEVALSGATEGLDHASNVEAQIRKMIEPGIKLTPDQIKAQAKAFNEAFTNVASLMATPKGKVQVEAVDKKDDVGSGDAPKNEDQTAAPVAEAHIVAGVNLNNLFNKS